MSDKILQPGNYEVTATIRHTVTIEKPTSEMEVVDEAVDYCGAELVNWEVEAK